MINGVNVAYCTNVSYSEEIQHDPIETLDLFEVAEHVPVAYRAQFSAQLVRLVGEPIKLREGLRIFSRLEDILNSEEMTATIEDKATGHVLANVERVKCTRYNNNVPARGTVAQDVEFVCIRIRDESEVV
jgi:hypothetical protein